MVRNDDLLETDQFRELQRFKAPECDQCDTFFKRALHIEDDTHDRFISLKCYQRFLFIEATKMGLQHVFSKFERRLDQVVQQSAYTIVCDAQQLRIQQLKHNDNVYRFDRWRDVQF
eukprot:278282_1